MSETVIFANRIPESNGQENPLEALKDAIAFGASDWGYGRDLAWVYGIVLGWDDPEHPEESAMDYLAGRYGWTDDAVARLRRLHAAFEALTATSPEAAKGGGES